MLAMLLKYLKKRLTVYLNFKIMIFLKFNFEFFAIDFNEKMHGKRWAASTRIEFILIKTAYTGSALKIRQINASFVKFG